MGIFTGNPYRDAPDIEPRDIKVKYPLMKISTPKRRMIQTAIDVFVIEEPTESTDSMGIVTTSWQEICTIKKQTDVDKAIYGRDEVPNNLVLWILSNS